MTRLTHLLVTNDFPPKTGGIQSYLWELWRRLPPDSFAVLTTRFEGADAFDREQPFRVERTSAAVLWPTAALARVSSYDYLVSMAVMPVGYALAGPAAAAAGFPAPLIVGAVLMCVPSIVTAFAPPVRAIVRHPDGEVTGPLPAYRRYKNEPIPDEG